MTAQQRKTATAKVEPLPGQPHDAAARKRIRQKRRQRVVRQVRRLEFVLPDAAMRMRVPHLAWPQAPTHLLRSRWLWAVALVLVLVCTLAAWVYADERWYIYTEDVHFNGLSYIDREELWRLSDIDGWNGFWIDTEAVRQRLLQHPYVADAQVHPAPLLGKVTVDITEARPVALWVTDGGTPLAPGRRHGGGTQGRDAARLAPDSGWTGGRHSARDASWQSPSIPRCCAAPRP